MRSVVFLVQESLRRPPYVWMRIAKRVLDARGAGDGVDGKDALECAPADEVVRVRAQGRQRVDRGAITDLG